MSQKWQTIKIFLSSTFLDMHKERDHLLHVVFPQLKARCRQKRINLIEIDLRWGVSKHDAEDGKILDICMDEVDACRPFFVGLLGHRYGWVAEGESHSITAKEIYHGVLHHFMPRQIMARDFKKIIEAQSLSEVQKQALANGYQWLGEKGKYCLKDDCPDPAIIQSIFKQFSSYKPDRCCFFFRQEALTRQLMGNKQDDYLGNIENLTKLAALKTEIKAAGLPVFEYNEIEAFGQQFLETLWERLQQEAENVPPTDWLAEEAEFHELFMADRTQRFVGRQAMLDEMQRFCQRADEPNIFVITGEPGSGKSTLMARFVEKFSEQHPSQLIIAHFIGASPTSTNLRLSLRRICALLDRAIGGEENLPDDINELIQGFSERLEKIERQVVIVLDAVNQFEMRDNPHAMHWLPQKMPKNLRVVISTLPGDAYDALLRRSPEVRTLTGLTAVEKRVLVNTYLQEIHHDFPNPQVAEDFFYKIRQATPLYILVALEELRVFGHFEQLQAKINQFPDTVAALFEQVLERLEGDFNPSLVRDCMRYIACGRQGMAASELQELLKFYAPTAKTMLFPDLLWIRLYRAFGFYLFERSGVIDFFHGALQEAVQKRYLEVGWEPTHRVIADYFEGRWQEPYSRAVEELPYQFYHAVDLKRLKALLLNYQWMAAKLEVTDIDTLIGDYDYLADEPTVRLVQQALDLSAHILRDDKTQLAGQLHGRLLSQSLQEIQGFLKQAIPSLPWLRSLKANLASPGGALIRTFSGFNEYVGTIAVTPDGSRVVSGSDDGIKVWDLTCGKLLQTLSGCFPFVNAVTPDGKRVVSDSWDHTLKVWDLANGQLLQTLSGHSDEITAITVTSDGSWVVSISKDETLKVWDLANGQLLHTLSGYFKKNLDVIVTVTPDRKLLLFHSKYRCNLKVWNLASGQLLHTLSGHSERVTAATVTSDGKKVVSGSSDQTLKVWDLASGQLLHTLRGHSRKVTVVTVTNDGSHVVSGSSDKTLKVWDLASSQLLHTLSGHTDSITDVTVTNDSSQVISGSSDKTLKVWDLASGQLLHTLCGHSGKVTVVTVTNDGSHVVSGSSDKTLKVWSLASSKQLHTLSGHSNQVRAITVTNDGSRVVSGSFDHTLKVWDLPNAQLLHTLIGYFHWAVTNDGSRVVSDSFDKTLKVRDLASGQLLHTLSGHTDSITDVTITNDDSRVVSSSSDKTLKVWDLTSGQLLHTLSGHTDSITDVTITNDGSRVVSSSSETSSDKTLKVWDLASGQLLHTLSGHTDSIADVTVTNDSSRVVSYSYDETLKIWDLANGQLLHTLSGYSSLLFSSVLTVTNDGSRVLFGLDDGTLKVWDLASGQLLHTLGEHTYSITNVTVTNDGSRMVSGSHDLKVWDLVSGKKLHTLRGHSDPVTAITITPNGSRVVSSSYDRTIKIWDLTTGLLLASLNLDASVECCAVAPDGKTIVAGDAGGMVHFLRLEM